MMRPLPTVLIVLVAASALAGCVEPQRHMGADFGMAVRQDAAAQVSDPDAAYRGPRNVDGRKSALATTRYQTGTVIEPQATSTKVGPALGAPAAAGGPTGP